MLLESLGMGLPPAAVVAWPVGVPDVEPGVATAPGS